MTTLFAETLKKLRKEKGITQEQLGKQMFVNHSTIARWESGTRLPDATMLVRIADVLGADVKTLLNAAAQSDEHPNVILVDDNKIILNGSLPILEEVIPNATVTGFTKPSDAVEFAKANRVALAFLDIEMGTTSGLDVCREILETNPLANIVYLTAYREYALDAWNTGAIGFMLKPITPEGVRKQLEKLKYPFWTGGEDE